MTHNFFCSFRPSDFQASITHLQNALTQITSWMTSNLLSLNSSKTEFLLIGLKRQLSKIHNSSTSIDTYSICSQPWLHIWRTFSLLRSDLCSLYPDTIIFVLFAVSVPLHRQNNCHLHRTLQAWVLQLSVLWSSEIWNKSSPTHSECSCSNIPTHHSYCILKPLHFWTKWIQEYLSHKILNTTEPPYLCDFLVVTTHALHFTSLWSNHRHHSKSFIAPSNMLHLIFGTSFLYHSEFLIQIIHPPLSDHHLNMPVYLATHCYHLPSLFHSVLKKLYLVRKSYPPPSSVSVCRTGLMALNRLLDLFAHRFYFLVPYLSVLVMPTCGRLSWPALWSTFRRTKKNSHWLIDWLSKVKQMVLSIKQYDNTFYCIVCNFVKVFLT